MNVGVGYKALFDLTTGDGNVAIGSEAASNLTIGRYNVAIGKNTLITEDVGDGTTAVGTGAGVIVRRVDTGAQIFQSNTTINSFSSSTVIRLSTNSETGGGTLSNLEMLVQGNVSADLMRVYFTDNVHNEDTLIIDETEIKFIRSHL